MQVKVYASRCIHAVLRGRGSGWTVHNYQPVTTLNPSCHVSRGRPSGSLNATLAILSPFFILGACFTAEVNVTLLLLLPAKLGNEPAAVAGERAPCPLLLRSASTELLSGVLSRGKLPAAAPPTPGCFTDALKPLSAAAAPPAAVPIRLVPAPVVGLLDQPFTGLAAVGVFDWEPTQSPEASDVSSPGTAAAGTGGTAPADSATDRLGSTPAAASDAALPQALVVLPRSPVVSLRGCIRA